MAEKDTDQQVNIAAHEVELILHALLLVEVCQQETHGCLPDIWSTKYTLPQACVEK